MRILALAALATFAASAHAKEGEVLDFGSWQIETASGDARVEEYLDRPTLFVRGGTVWLDGVQLEDGVIEFDIAFDEHFGFAGPVWHAADSDNAEFFYLRTAYSGAPDASQYTPIQNGNDAWQIYNDEHAAAALSFAYGGWNHVKIVTIGDRADIYFNGSSMPVIHVPKLETGIGNGKVGFRSLSASNEVRISDIVVRPLSPDDRIVGKYVAPQLDKDLLTRWRVSPSFAEAEIANSLTMENPVVPISQWQQAEVERNGILNISRLHNKADGNAAFVGADIDAPQATLALLRFGYSDRARIYLNGTLLFSGQAQWRSRDNRFLGTVGLFDSVTLPLREGRNELRIAVSETFGGWAWMGAIESEADLKID